jgi:drug/metabolite transporter (DMT)-like permease
MTAFILCILCTGGIFLVFRLYKTLDINTPIAIVVNYAVAGTLGWSLAGGLDAMVYAYEQPWFFINAIMGIGFLALFNLIAKCTKEMGVAVASIATKLSMIIPVVGFIAIFPGDHLTWQKGVAFSMAILAIFLTTGGAYKKSTSKWAFALPVIIFIGSGLIDMDFGYFSSDLESDSHMMAFTSVPFTVAFIWGMLLRINPKYRHSLSTKDVAGGVLLGVVNFGSLFFLLTAYETSGLDKSSLIPAVNIGVVIFSTLGAILLFKEKPSTRIWIGLALGCSSIAILLI